MRVRQDIHLKLSDGSQCGQVLDFGCLDQSAERVPTYLTLAKEGT